MHYRSDIDGLRAVAVIMVLMFHGGLGLFPSGFVGVDIFFVISGFLITSIITTSLKEEKFSLADFYARRLWRLQPALITIVIFSLIMATVFYLPADFIDYVKSAKYTTLFTSNQYFSRSTTGYAAPDTAYILLLHTWSLSIEWQWYILLPFGILFLNRYFTESQVKIATILIVLCTMALSLYLSEKHPDKSYYYFTSRIFEFMTGSCLVIFNHKGSSLNKKQSFLTGLISFITIIYCATRKDIVLGYPDYHSIMVCIASALLIMSGTSAKGIPSKILSSSPLVFIGTISYSLYLWHWPIFATGRYLGAPENLKFKISCFLLTFITAYASYIFIEKPCRKKRWPLTKTFSVLAFLPALFFVLLNPIVSAYNGFNGRFNEEYTQIESTLQKYASPYRESCLNGNIDGTDKNCIIGYPNAKKRALLIGDSHSNHFWNFFDVLGKNAHLAFTVQGTSSCLTLPGIYLFDWWFYKNTVYKDCHDNTQVYFKNIKNGGFDYVIFGEIWTNYAGDNIINRVGDKRSVFLSRQRIEFAMKEALDNVVKSGATPVIVKAIYPMPNNFMNCFYQHIKTRQNYNSQNCNPAPWKGDSDEWFTQLFNKMKEHYPSLIIIDPKDVQCSGEKCRTEINGVPVYRDVGHLNDYASYKLGEEYIRLSNPFR